LCLKDVIVIALLSIEKSNKMKHLVSLPTLYKRDTAGRIREWTVEYGYDDDDNAGTRTVSGLSDGKKVTSVWNITEAKNVGKVNATNAREQAVSEAQSLWDINVEKEYFENVADIDSYTKFKPMLAHDYTKRPQSSGYSQPKLDGIRCIADKNGLWTRSGKEITSCPHIWDAIGPILRRNPNMVFDGELYNHELKEDFNKITSLVRKVKTTEADRAEAAKLVQYHVYDCYDHDQPDLTFNQRDRLFTNIFLLVQDDKIVSSESTKSTTYESLSDTQPRVQDVIKLVEALRANDQEELDSMYRYYLEQGYEGQMVRNSTPYEFKRSKNLLKRKEFITEEFRVVEVLEGSGNWAGYAKRFVLEMADGTQFGSNVRGSQDQLRALLHTDEQPTWATCRYFELTPDGVPRFPVVIDYGVGERED
jgi:ATP-dependent DNA ligase